MSNPPPIITLLTDFGETDAYVGIMKGVMLGITPHANLVDLTHQVDPQDVHLAALILFNAYRYFPEHTVHLVVVDPGVGTQRRPIAVRTPRGQFVAPDNGVLSAVLDGEESWSAVELAEPRYRLPEPSRTFHGRDIFSPAAAHLAAGVALKKLGPEITDLVRLPVPALTVTSNSVRGEVVRIDHFGNAITNILPLRWVDDRTLAFMYAPGGGDAAAFPAPFPAAAAIVTVGWHTLRGVHTTYHGVATGQAVAIVGSNNDLEIAVNQGSAADALSVKVGAPVILRI